MRWCLGIPLILIDKAANNLAIICECYYIEVILEIAVVQEENNTSTISNVRKFEIIKICGVFKKDQDSK